MAQTKHIFDYLVKKIGNPIGACALMGNLYVESRLESVYLEGSYAKKFGMTSEEYTILFDQISGTEIDTFVHDSAGYGLAQWTYWSRKKALWEFAKKRGKSVGDLDTQLDYLWEEIQKYKQVIPELQNATSIREASDVVCLKYEKPQHTEEKYLQNRANYGQKFYDEYAIKMEVKENKGAMNSAIYVDQKIAEIKKSGKSPSDKAWEIAKLCVGWAYVFGAYGEYCDPTNRRSRYNGTKEEKAKAHIKAKCKNFNGKDTVPSGCVGCQWFVGSAASDESKHEGRTRFFDCRGFVYFILHKVLDFWKSCPAGATSMWNTASNWEKKGLVSDGVPNDILVCLFYKEKNDPSKMAHIGFGYKGQTIECGSGVEYHEKYNSKWTHWAIPKCVVNTVKDEASSKDEDLAGCPTLKVGDSGSSVKTMQQLLSNAGSSLQIDGIFGSGTRSALVAFQKKHGLEADGVCGPKTWAKLIGYTAAITDNRLYTVTLKHVPESEAETLLGKYEGSAQPE